MPDAIARYHLSFTTECANYVLIRILPVIHNWIETCNRNI